MGTSRRISIDRNDPGFRADAFDPVWIVTLDGVELNDCVTADEDDGKVTVYARGPSGEYIKDDTGEAIATTVLKGKVVISRRAKP